MRPALDLEYTLPHEPYSAMGLSFIILVSLTLKVLTASIQHHNTTLLRLPSDLEVALNMSSITTPGLQSWPGHTWLSFELIGHRTLRVYPYVSRGVDQRLKVNFLDCLRYIKLQIEDGHEAPNAGPHKLYEHKHKPMVVGWVIHAESDDKPMELLVMDTLWELVDQYGPADLSVSVLYEGQPIHATGWVRYNA